MIRTKNPDILRRKVIEIEAKIKAIIEKGYRGWPWDRSPVQRDRIDDLLSSRGAYLNAMFRATPGEVERFERLNGKFLRMEADMRKRAQMMWDTLVKMEKVPEFDDEYEVEGIMKIQGWDEECEVLKLDDDDYYGSDFQLMCELLNEMQYSDTGQAHAHSCLKISDVSQGNTAPGHDWNRTMEDGTTWAEGPLRHPALDHICICWPIHDLCTHNHYSIPDLLRINDFKATVTLTVEHLETQSGVRSSQPGYRPWIDAVMAKEIRTGI